MSTLLTNYDEKYGQIIDWDLNLESFGAKRRIRYTVFKPEIDYKLFEKREHLRRGPFWKKDNKIFFDINETPRNCFFPIELEGENYLIGITEDEKLVMYLAPEKTR